LKIIAVSTCGSYESWTQHAIASIYNSVDKIVVINGGIDISGKEAGDDIPLQRDLKQLKEIDIDNKITQIRPHWYLVKRVDKKTCEAGRARNISFAFQAAHAYGTKGGETCWIYKMDSDQICDESFTRKALEDLANSGEHDGYRFAEYADFFRSYNRCQALPDNFTDDGSLFFKSHADAWAIGQGSPVHYREQHEIHSMRTFHMRRICPPDLNPWDYYYKRFYYHTWGPNSIGELPINKDGRILINDEIKDIATKQADSVMESQGHTIDHFNNDERFPPRKPLVVSMGPLEYIKQGYPK